MRQSNAEKFDDVLIAGDINQDVSSEWTQKFMKENGLAEVHEIVNEAEDDRKDNTHAKESKKIDAMMATDRTMQATRGSKITDFQEIINTDHRGFVIDLDAEDFFSIESSKHDQTDNATLDSTKRVHREKFKEKLDEHIDQIKSEEIVNSI